jgi:predicted HicB family RNase H-like nuclease
MKSFMDYKGYQGSVHISDEEHVLFGNVMFIPALISYEGTDVKSLREAFQEAVDDYLQLCEEQGKAPAKPLKGSFNVRTRPELHRRAVQFAQEHKKNLNAVVTEALEHYLKIASHL